VFSIFTHSTYCYSSLYPCIALTLLTIFTKTINDKNVESTAIAIAPPVLFILSSVAYIISFFPQHGELSVDDLQEVERVRVKIVKRRKILLLVLCPRSSFEEFCGYFGVGQGAPKEHSRGSVTEKQRSPAPKEARITDSYFWDRALAATTIFVSSLLLSSFVFWYQLK